MGGDAATDGRFGRASVVLVHGIRTSATMWRGQLARLAALGIPARAIDLPGHGARLGERFALEGARTAIDDAVDAARSDGGPVLLVGLSLGGYLAMDAVGRRPDAVDGLVAASAGTLPRGPGLAGYRAIARSIAALPDRGRALNDRMTRAFLSPAAADDVLAGGVALDVMDEGLAAVGTTDPIAALARYPGPVWLVNGRFDHFRLEERRFLRACVDGRLVIIPGATHLVSLVRPDEFAAVVAGAVAEVERRAGRRTGRGADVARA
ncbi:alpha/beta fold hydrolase [Agromyces sp. MMS17-SY077]|uniref:Alpha/beta fold hydrolase n=2 Tax=Agromyces seonyuensis TaxID=2662446 RepID=A0A6I4P541_9MICO|nr:alpha/beta fold hydrolase [Agromyces seonyuensis]